MESGGLGTSAGQGGTRGVFHSQSVIPSVSPKTCRLELFTRPSEVDLIFARYARAGFDVLLALCLIHRDLLLIFRQVSLDH